VVADALADLPDAHPPAEGTWLPGKPCRVAVGVSHSEAELNGSSSAGIAGGSQSRPFCLAGNSSNDKTDGSGCRSSSKDRSSSSSAEWSHADTNAPTFATATANATTSRSDNISTSTMGKVEYLPDQLDALALLFTAVKVLFLGGGLLQALRLCQLLDPAIAASKVPLHLTLIRNEAAYYGCIRQLLDLAPSYPLADAPELQPLYLCGDSHCLSGELQIEQQQDGCGQEGERGAL
jgi:hypothetical protein